MAPQSCPYKITESPPFSKQFFFRGNTLVILTEKSFCIRVLLICCGGGTVKPFNKMDYVFWDSAFLFPQTLKNLGASKAQHEKLNKFDSVGVDWSQCRNFHPFFMLFVRLSWWQVCNPLHGRNTPPVRSLPIRTTLNAVSWENVV